MTSHCTTEGRSGTEQGVGVSESHQNHPGPSQRYFLLYAKGLVRVGRSSAGVRADSSERRPEGSCLVHSGERTLSGLASLMYTLVITTTTEDKLSTVGFFLLSFAKVRGEGATGAYEPEVAQLVTL